MKNWTAADWCLAIFALTVPYAITIMAMGRIITGTPMTDSAIGAMKEIISVIAGGVLVKLGDKLAQNLKP